MIDFAAESQRRYIDNMADTIVTAAFIHCMIDLSFQIMAAVGCWEAAEEGQEKTMKKALPYIGRERFQAARALCKVCGRQMLETAEMLERIAGTPTTEQQRQAVDDAANDLKAAMFKDRELMINRYINFHVKTAEELLTRPEAGETEKQ